MTRAYLGGFEITDQVQKWPSIIEQKNFETFSVINKATISVKNKDGLFSIGNKNSIIGDNCIGTPLILTDDITGSEEIFFSGELEDGPTEKNHEATLIAKNFLIKYLDQEVAYTNANENAATIALGLLNAFDVPNKYIDSNSFLTSSAILNANGVTLSVDWKVGGNTTIVTALSDLAKFSNAYLYTFRNKIYFKIKTDLGPSYNKLYSHREYQNIKRKAKVTKYMYNDYSIKYLGVSGVATKDIDNNNIGNNSRTENKITKTFTLDGAEGNNISIDNLASAIWIGENTMLRNINPIDIIIFEIPIKYEGLFNLESIFALNNSLYNYDITTFETMKISRLIGSKEFVITGWETQ